MRLFNILFKKKTPEKTENTEIINLPIPEPEPFIEQSISIPEFKVTLTIEQEENELVGELSHLDFGKPNGQLGRFLNYQRYEVICTDDCGKRKIRIRTGVDAQQAIEKVASEGFLPPFEAKLLEHEPPTEKQLNYLKNLGIVVPDDITKDDASYMISRAIGEDSQEGPSTELVTLATGLKTEFSAFIGDSGLFSSIIDQACQRDRAALYAYGVRQNMRGNTFKNMLEDPELPFFYSFADCVISDPNLTRSLRGRSSEDFRKPHRGTDIYKAAVVHFTDGDII